MLNTDHLGVMTKLSWRENLHYRAEMLISLITGPCYLVIHYIIWKAIFDTTTEASGTLGQTLIGGYTFPEMMSYYILTFTVSYITWDGTCDWMESEISKGNFSSLLLRPMQVYRHYLYYKIGHRILAFLIEFIPVMLISTLIFGINPLSWDTLLPFAISALLASYIYYQIQFIMGTTTFWTTKSTGLTRIVTWTSALFAGKYFPLTLLPIWAQWIFLILPFGMTSYFPVQAALGGATIAGIMFNPWMLILTQLCYIFILDIGMIRFYNYSVSRFGGVGI